MTEEPTEVVAIMAATVVGLVVAFPSDVLRRFHPRHVASAETAN